MSAPVEFTDEHGDMIGVERAPSTVDIYIRAKGSDVDADAAAVVWLTPSAARNLAAALLELAGPPTCAWCNGTAEAGEVCPARSSTARWPDGKPHEEVVG